MKALGALAFLAAAALPAGLPLWPVAGVAAALVALCGGLWWRGTVRASQAMAVVDYLACGLGLVRCAPTPRPFPDKVTE
jgi:hypothetical protein